ncbi:MAG: DUF5119 domain-containing protein [Dysgonamonadaceae bacterium]|jgi:hypothetical protein|nr:DUF5119 domain-containing protein [Dysgonamonadaceae bacterium]
MKLLKISFFALSALLLSACKNDELFPSCRNNGDIPVRIIIRWEGEKPAATPGIMSVFWYAGSGWPVISDYESNGGEENLSEGTYLPVCLDYYGNSRLDFHITENADEFEVYNIRATGLYNQYADLVADEPTVAEAKPYAFYVDTRPQIVDKIGVLPGDTLTLYFYPENVLQEFTFLIHGVEGAKNMARNSGAISGMSASYFPATGALAEKPSTLLFERVTPVVDGQSYPWSDAQKALFASLEPDWDNPGSERYWGGDWITGKFCTFGPVDIHSQHFRLTVEAVSKSNYYYYGTWGYWFGQWEDMVGAQIKGSMEGNGAGSPKERKEWWRRQNGGFDIVIGNNGRLVVPGSNGGDNEDGNGFIVDADEWGDNIDVRSGKNR